MYARLLFMAVHIIAQRFVHRIVHIGEYWNTGEYNRVYRESIVECTDHCMHDDVHVSKKVTMAATTHSDRKVFSSVFFLY